MITVRKAGNDRGNRISFHGTDVAQIEEVVIRWEKAGLQDCVQIHLYGGKSVLVADPDRQMLDSLNYHVSQGLDHDYSEDDVGRIPESSGEDSSLSE